VFGFVERLETILGCQTTHKEPPDSEFVKLLKNTWVEWNVEESIRQIHCTHEIALLKRILHDRQSLQLEVLRSRVNVQRLEVENRAM
jgi:hypothetical protein